MSVLTSLLVRDQVVSVRKIEEAIQQQVIAGGTVETVLLEMNAVAENVMSAYKAAGFGLLPATRDEVMMVPRDTVRRVPRDVATRYRMMPLSAEGRTLVVAVSEPLSQEDDQQLGFLLGCELVQRIVTEARLCASLSHHYEMEVEPRLRRLAEKLRGRDPGEVPYVAPPPSGKVGSRSDVPRKFVDDDDDDEDLFESPRITGKYAFGVSSKAPAAGSGGVAAGESAPPGVAEASFSDTASVRPGRRLRGPLAPKAALELLDQAADRDAILEIFFAFARQFFDYTALFVVHDDIAEGRDANGSGASGDDVRRLAVPLDIPGSFAAVREAPVARSIDLRHSELDAITARDLGRVEAQPAVLLPLTIRQRVVLILYGDRNGEPFGVADLPELLAFAPRVADAFERIILARKFRDYAAPAAEGASQTSEASSLKAAASVVSAHVAERPARSAEGWGGANTADPPRAAVKRSLEGAAAATAQPTPPRGRRRTVLGMPAGESGLREPGATKQAPVGPRVTLESWGGPPTAASRPALMEHLGVPRSAPPPPMVPQPPPVGVGKTSAEADDEAILGGSDAVVGLLPPAPVERDEASDGSDEPELIVEASSEVDFEGFDDEEDSRRMLDAPDVGDPTVGTYRVQPATEELVGPRRSSPRAGADGVSRGALGGHRERMNTRPVKRHARRGDARREEPGETTRREVVRLGPAAPTAATSSEEVAIELPLAAVVRPSDPFPNEPSVIVDMGDSVEALTAELMSCGPEDEGAIVQMLLATGEAALPVLVSHFPGPLWFDRRQPHRRLPRGRDVSAIARALSAFRVRAVLYVASLLEVDDADARFYATLLAAELVHPELVQPLGRRIFDEDDGTRALALDVLRLFRTCSAQIDELLRELRATARVRGKEPERRRIAVRALGELRDAGAVELLVETLADSDQATVEVAVRSLSLITRQDFGESVRRWQTWVERNRGRHRIEWLIDALLHDDEQMRATAGEELKQLTQQYYGYHPALPKHDREVAQRKYRAWWNEEGRKRFQ